MKPCGFGSSSTNHDTGKAEAPKVCREAIADKHKRFVTVCDIMEPDKCPLGKYIEDKVDIHREEGWVR
jgi:hypothetical protein